jgi:hypothetical protein
MTDVILQGPGAFDHSTLDPDLAEEARARAGRKNADFGPLSFDIGNHLRDLVFGIAAPSTQLPLSGVDFAICGACAADRARLMARAAEGLRLIWPDLRPIVVTHPEGANA